MRNKHVRITVVRAMLTAMWRKVVPSDKARRIANATLRTALQKDKRMDPIGDCIENFRATMGHNIKLKELVKFGAIRSYDLNRLPGIVFMPFLTDKVVNLSKKYGVGVVSIKNSGGVDFLSTWLLEIPSHDCIGIFIWNGGAYTTVPYGSLEPFFGTNPFAYAIPTAGNPLLLDMSTSEITFLDLMNAIEGGRRIPKCAGLDERGKYTNDPNRVYNVAADSDVRLVPIGGGHKGSGIVLAIEVLTGALIDSKMAREASSTPQKPEEFGGVLIAINVAAFTSIARFRKRVTRMLAQIRLSKPMGDNVKIVLPGDRSYCRERIRLRSGTIALNTTVLEELETFSR